MDLTTAPVHQHHASPSLVHQPKPSLFETLPPEIHLRVADFLEECEKACLALCSRTLLGKSDDRCWDAIHIRKGSHNLQRFQFLFRLARDLPDCFCCYNCSLLHTCGSVRLPWQMYQQLHFTTWFFPPPFVDAVGCRLPAASTHLYYRGQLPSFEMCSVNSDYMFTFQHLQLAMAKYRDNRNYGIDLDTLSWTEIRRSSVFGHKFSTLLSVDAAVVQSQLCLRVQHWIAFDWRGPTIFVNTHRANPEICLHIWIQNSPKFERMVRCGLNHHQNREPKCEDCRNQICKICGVEFAIDITDLDHGGGVFILTKWLNLGHGESPMDAKWQRHLTSGTSRNQAWLPPYRDEILLSKSFDNGKSLEMLTEENAGELRRQLFRQTFVRRKARNGFRDKRRNKDMWIRRAVSCEDTDSYANRIAFIGMLATLVIGVICGFA